MRIVGAKVFEYVRQLDGRSWNPVSRWNERRAPLLLLYADNGHVGVGEAWSRQDRIECGLEALAEWVAAHVVGKTFRGAAAVRAVAERRSEASWMTSAAASAVDIALWDLLARSRAEPLWQTLGGTAGRVRAYASGGLYRDGGGAGDLAAEVSGYVRDGFRDVKIKVGGQPPDIDVDRIRTARAAIGAQGELWVDAVNQLPPASAVGVAKAYAAAGATAIQAPVSFDDVTTMAAIQRDALRVVAGESEFAVTGFDSLLAADAVGLLQLNLGLCGGFSGAAVLARKAAARKTAVTAQTHGTAVLQAAALHFGAATRKTQSVEYHRFHDHLGDLLDVAARTVADGHVELGDAPGSGLKIPVPGVQRDAGVIRLFRQL